MIGIYKITNLDNGKMYVGQSLNIEQRWVDHRADLRNNHHRNGPLQYSWNKHGEDKFKFSIIEECSEDKLNEREMYWIDKLRTYVNFEDSHGYNLTLGGEGTRYIHEVLRFDLSGNFLDEWDNGCVASRELGINTGSIYGCCLKKLKRADKYIFVYKEDYIDRNSLDWYFEDRKTAPVLQCDFEGNILDKWNGCAEATKDLGYNIMNCLLGNTMTCNGFIYIYEDDYSKLTPEYLAHVKDSYYALRPKRIYQVNSNGEIVRVYDSLREVDRNGFSKSMVCQCCTGKRENVKGYVFCYDYDFDRLSSEEYAARCKVDNSRKKREVIQHDLDGNVVHIYKNIADAKKDGFTAGCISDCCNGLCNTYKGFRWEFGEETSFKDDKPVFQYDKDFVLIAQYNSIKEAALKTGINKKHIGNNCRGKSKTSHGYIFSFELKGV